MQNKTKKELTNIIDSINSLKELQIVKSFNFIDKDLDIIKKRAEDDTFKLAVIGEFSSGKSTFINAIIGKDLLSHAVDETTATIIYIHNVDIEDEKQGICEINYVDGKGEKILLSDCSQLTQYSTTHSDISVVDNIKSIDIYTHFINIKAPIVIIDTPGLNGVADKHREITINEVKNSHACIYLLSVKGFTQSDIDFIKILTKYQSFFIFIQNFIDTLKITEGETLEKKLDQANDNIKKEFCNKENLEYKICGISALQALVSKDKNIKRVYANDTEDISEEERNKLLENSNYYEFEKILMEYINTEKYKETIITSAIQALDSIINRLLFDLCKQKEENEKIISQDYKSEIVKRIEKRLDQIEKDFEKNKKKLINHITTRRKSEQEYLEKDIKDKLKNVYNEIERDIDNKIKKFEDFKRIKGKNPGKYFSDEISANINNEIIPELNNNMKSIFQSIYSSAILRMNKYLGNTEEAEREFDLDLKIETESTVSLEEEFHDMEDKIESEKKNLREKKAENECLEKDIEDINDGIRTTEMDIDYEEKRYHRKEREYQENIKKRGKRPKVEKREEEREKQVKREGLFHRSKDAIFKPKIEVYYETVYDYSKVDEWEKENEKLKKELLEAEERYYNNTEKLEEKLHKYKRALEFTGKNYQKEKEKIERLEKKISYMEDEYNFYKSNAKMEFCNLQKKRLKDGFKTKIFNGEKESGSILLNIHNYIDKTFEEHILKIEELVIKNFEHEVKNNKEKLNKIKNRNIKELEKECKIQEDEIKELERIKDNFKKLKEN